MDLFYIYECNMTNFVKNPSQRLDARDFFRM